MLEFDVSSGNGIAIGTGSGSAGCPSYAQALIGADAPSDIFQGRAVSEPTLLF